MVLSPQLLLKARSDLNDQQQVEKALLSLQDRCHAILDLTQHSETQGMYHFDSAELKPIFDFERREQEDLNHQLVGTASSGSCSSLLCPHLGVVWGLVPLSGTAPCPLGGKGADIRADA